MSRSGPRRQARHVAPRPDTTPERTTSPPRNQTRGPRRPRNTTPTHRGWASSATMRSRTSPSRTNPVEVERWRRDLAVRGAGVVRLACSDGARGRAVGVVVRRFVCQGPGAAAACRLLSAGPAVTVLDRRQLVHRHGHAHQPRSGGPALMVAARNLPSPPSQRAWKRPRSNARISGWRAPSAAPPLGNRSGTPQRSAGVRPFALPAPGKRGRRPRTHRMTRSMR